MEKNNRIKMAVIAGAVAAIKYSESHKFAASEEIIKAVTKDIDKILENIDN